MNSTTVKQQNTTIPIYDLKNVGSKAYFEETRNNNFAKFMKLDL